MPRPAFDLAVLIAVFALATAIAGALGAANFGTALAFGQMGFALALVSILMKG